MTLIHSIQNYVIFHVNFWKEIVLTTHVEYLLITSLHTLEKASFPRRYHDLDAK